MLSRLTLRDFRCFTQASLTPHSRLTFLVGRNAQGKTSLLEAACILMRLQSPRTTARADWMRFGAESCLVEGAWDDRVLRYTQTRGARRLAIDGAVCPRMADYLAATALVVWMDHADMNLARGGPEHRRRHLDFAASQLFPGYLPALRQYERALRARNFLLKRDAVVPWREVDAYGVLLDRAAAEIRRGRAELVRRMQPWIADAQMRLGAGGETAAAEYVPGFAGDSLSQALLGLREEERRSRTTAAGTHRDELRLLVSGREAGAFASEGQQRTLSLALKLAQARVLEQESGAPPLLLLDDVFGELDPDRRRALLDYLPRDSQKIVTATSLDWVAGGSFPDASAWDVSDGGLQERP